MKREQLEHFVVVGSQAILLFHPDAPAVAARDKDADYVRALLKHHLIDADRLEQRLRCLDDKQYPVDRFIAWARRRAQEALACTPASKS